MGREPPRHEATAMDPAVLPARRHAAGCPGSCQGAVGIRHLLLRPTTTRACLRHATGVRRFLEGRLNLVQVDPLPAQLRGRADLAEACQLRGRPTQVQHAEA